MLTNQVSEIMVNLSDFKTVKSDEYFHEALEALDFNHWGGVFIVDAENKLEGIFTDGDARRVLTKNQDPIAMLNTMPISNFMTSNPMRIQKDSLVKEAIEMMNEKQVLVLPIVNEKNILLGLIHLQHAVKELLKLASM